MDDKTTNDDIVEILMRFDSFLDDMYDRGAFDCTDPFDKELDDFVNRMKDKYLKK